MTNHQDITEKGDQPNRLLSDILTILKRHSLIFSDRGVHFILEAIRQYKSSLIVPPRPTKSQLREKIKTLKNAASQLSAQLHELSWHILLEDPPDSLQLRLNNLALCCNHWLTHGDSMKSEAYYKVFGREGRPLRSGPLSSLVQMLILTYEEETKETYVKEEATAWGRERTSFNTLVQEFIKDVLRVVAPEQDPVEAIKTARHSPVPLDWTRKMKKMVDADSTKIE